MAEETSKQGNIRQEYNTAQSGLDMDSSVSQIAKGKLSYALNATIENFDSNSINYQNESGNEYCLQFPEGYQLIGEHFIPEKSKHIFFLSNSVTNDSQIGYMDDNDCVYRIYVNAPCLNFNINFPIHKTAHKINNCSTEIYWTDGYNPRRYLNLDDIPYILKDTDSLCSPVFTNEIDCNQLKIQPNFEIPILEITDVISGGDLLAGTYQFAIQYSDVSGIGYSSYFSVTNPVPIADVTITTLNFNYPVGKSIVIDVSNLDITGYFQYYNVAVIKTINNIPSVELIGTYFIDTKTKQITYTGQNVTQIRLTISDVFEKYPYYEIAQDLTVVQDVLVWDNLTSIDRINYQKIANEIELQWQTYRIPEGDTYEDELNATNLRGYLRDEVYAFEIVFLLKNGKQTDGFHIPGRLSVGSADDLPNVPTTNPDFVGEPDYFTGLIGFSKYWKIYNTATLIGFAPEYVTDITYKGPYQYGDFSYWESKELYPCDENVWGELSNTPIRHHKFPDIRISPIFESKLFSTPGSMVMGNNVIFPIGVKLDVSQISTLILNSSLSQNEKDNVAGFKIVRGDRGTNKSIVAKGILRNVGKYTREETDYYYPNYPYNDVSTDPFLLDKTNAYTAPDGIGTSTGGCRNFTITGREDGTIEYINCYTNEIVKKTFLSGEEFSICALGLPEIFSGKACMVANTYDVYKITPKSPNYNVGFKYINPNGTSCHDVNSLPSGWASWCDYCDSNPTYFCCTGSTVVTRKFNKTIFTKTTNIPFEINSLIFPEKLIGYNFYITYVKTVEANLCDPLPLEGFKDEEMKHRQIFNSPETSFGQPFLGDVIKMENVIFGAGKAHFVQVKKNSLYKMLTKEAQQDALKSASDIATITSPIDMSALFAAYQAYLTIYINGITRRNYGYSFNSIADYGYSANIDNNLGIKQRELDLARYIIPGVQSVGDDKNINNYQRESSVYLKTADERFGNIIPPLSFPDKIPELAPGGLSVVSDDSRFTLSSVNRGDCNAPGKELPISTVVYYASLKNIFINQWGQIYSYNTIDTGFQRDIIPLTVPVIDTVFGGDTFISKFTYKSKLPFFIDNRVGAPDDSDIFYDEIGNVAFPKYWYSSRSVLNDGDGGGVTLKNFISTKAHNLDCPNKQIPDDPVPNPGRTYYDGKMYLFAYGIPSFYCESSINVDLRQAFNNREGDFFPHVSSGIPDDWVQESFTTIAQDNTYYYNVTYSKQNKENFFSHLPPNWEEQLCFTNFPFRAIYSNAQNDDPTNKTNNWLKYGAVSFFDFPQNYGSLNSLDGIQNKAVLARFENKSLLYNTMLTINTSNPQAAYLGNDTLFRSSPPIDFAETDLGYVGSQNKLLLKIPQGQITIDAKRGQVFLISGNQITDISAFGSGMNGFFTDHLPFEILKSFPLVNIDNHFNGIGLHGTFDSKYNRVIISKLDYAPITEGIKYDDVTKEYYIEETFGGSVLKTVVYLTDRTYFCNKSWTLSYNVNSKSWVSFHSYIPNFYIAENNFFYSGNNDCCGDFDAIVAIPGGETSTTTTSSTSTSSTTSTTTTIFTPDCDLEGNASQKVCDIEGNAVEQ